MENNDTIRLLKECDAGTKMAVTSINDVLDNLKDANMKELMKKSKENHEKLGNDIHAVLIQYNSEEKEPNAMAKSMSWIKTNMKLAMDDSDKTIADLLTDGCNMGIKSLYKYKNQYPAAESNVVSLCDALIEIEKELRRDLRAYL